MKYKSGYCLVILIFITLSASAQKKKDYTPLVDPFIGTGGHGHTFPGAMVPFGMVQLSPDTRLSGWDGCSGYHYSDTVVYGFSHTHLSGTGIPDYCDVLFMPTTGQPQLKNTDYRSVFHKKNESASPGYYKTRLDKYNIDVELTASKRVGVHRYTFPGGTRQANIIIDLLHRDKVLDSWIEVVNDHEVRGFRRSKSWANDQYVYFYAKFSKPFKTYGIALNDTLQPGKQRLQGTNIKMYLQFDNPGEVIAKVGISSVSAEGALNNLDTEVPGFDFKKVEKAAKAVWNDELLKIHVEGGAPAAQQPPPNMNQNPYGYGGMPQRQSRQPYVDYARVKQTIFYTALYHTMCAPNVYSDADGQYRGLDKKVHQAKGFEYYTVFSLWDTYRAENPLQTVINRKRTLDFIKSFLAMYDDGGLLPIWPLASSETYCMVGNHSIPVIVDAYAKGIKDFDAEKALTAMKSAVNRNQFGLASYRANGAVLASDEQESVSKTLEYAFDDWCIAQMAKMMNKPQDYADFIKRAQYWKNLYDNQTGFMRARTNGGWFAPFLPTDVNNNYTEGNAWQYAFLVPQDVNGLIDHMGGKERFEAKLNELFTTTDKLTGRPQDDIAGLIGQYAHGNEPSHHMAYLFNFTDNPYKTQLYVSKIMRDLYKDAPDGLAGNEDCGQMSAWYVMSALGFYTIAPGGPDFQIGLPAFDKAVINLENGKKFTITSSGSSASSFYLQGMNLNKNPYNKLYLTYNDLANGGDWEVFAGRLPNQLFMQDLERPVSRISDELIVPNPYILAPSALFKESLTIAIGCVEADSQIYYTLDGSVPSAGSTLFTKPFTLSATAIVKCIAVKNGKSSFVSEGKFTRLRSDLKITYLSKFDPSYAASGADALIDGTYGTTNWRIGNWQGFHGNNLEAVLDMGTVKSIKKISIETLQDTGAWIVFPRDVEYLVSDDGKTFKQAATISSKIDIKQLAVQTQTYSAELTNTNARYIKIIARQYGTLPDWHESKGSQSYIFADEVKVEL